MANYRYSGEIKERTSSGYNILYPSTLIGNILDPNTYTPHEFGDMIIKCTNSLPTPSISDYLKIVYRYEGNFYHLVYTNEEEKIHSCSAITAYGSNISAYSTYNTYIGNKMTNNFKNEWDIDQDNPGYNLRYVKTISQGISIGTVNYEGLMKWDYQIVTSAKVIKAFSFTIANINTSNSAQANFYIGSRSGLLIDEDVILGPGETRRVIFTEDSAGMPLSISLNNTGVFMQIGSRTTSSYSLQPIIIRDLSVTYGTNSSQLQWKPIGGGGSGGEVSIEDHGTYVTLLLGGLTFDLDKHITDENRIYLADENKT